MSATRLSRGERGAAGPGAIIAGTVVSLVLAFFVTVLLPLGSESTEADAGQARSYDDLALMGRTLYIREGCFSCHTQAVRNTFADSLLGPAPSEQGLYLNEAPNLIGVLRLGPDLSCVGDREDDPARFVAHLEDPQAFREHSTMPSYGYLSRADLGALAQYLLRLTCEGA